MTRAGMTSVIVLLAGLAATPLAGRQPPRAPAAQPQAQSVRITAERANVRAEPHDKGAVLTQLPSGTVLPLKGTEGTWYRVELPPDSRMGQARVEGWVSRAVASLVGAGAQQPARPGGRASGPTQAPLGATVALQTGSTTSELAVEHASLRAIDAQADSLRGLVALFPAGEAPLAATGSAPATFVWALPGRSSSRGVEEGRPVFLVTYKDVATGATNLVPAIVRLPATLSGVRLVAAVRTRADQAARTQADWNVGRDLRQELVGAKLDLFEAGSARLQPSSNLDRGEYAVVLRLREGRQVSGASVLTAQGEGRILEAAWTFSVK